MKLRTYITKVFGGIAAAIREYSQAAAVVRAVDERVGKQGAHGKHRPKNPFRGIACSNGSSYGLRFFRHVEGARDESPTWRRRDTDLRKLTFRTPNPVPVSFTE